MNEGYLLTEVTRITGIRSYRIIYAIKQGYIPDVIYRINNQRIFSGKDIEAIKIYFSTKDIN